MTQQEAYNELYRMWENGILPSNFTEDHSEYEMAAMQLMKLGYLDLDDFL